MADRHYIAVDLGAESGRVMLSKVSSSEIALTELHRFPTASTRVGKTFHWDILRLWSDIQAGIAKAVTAVGGAKNVAGIGVDTWGVDFGLFDEDGALLGNPVCYRDDRTAGMPEKVEALLPRAQLYGVTGIQSMFFNTIYQLAALSFGKSAQLRAAKRLLFMPDIINYWLSGKMANEYTIASTSMLLDARARTWSDQVLAAIGVPRSLFPEMVFPATAQSSLGGVQPLVGDTLGATGIPVLAVGCHDTASAYAAIPATGGNDWLCLSSGTWSLLGAEVDQPVLSGKAAEYNVTNEGGVGGKIRLLKNIVGMWPLQECRREWSKQGQEIDYATLTALAEKAPAKLAVLDLNDPEISKPGQMPQKITAQLQRRGQKVPQSPGEFARVIFESLALRYAEVIRELSEITGQRFTKLHIVGGGSQNNLLNQLAANATGLSVHAGPIEATALGNVMSQAISTGQLASIAAGRDLIRRSSAGREFKPR